MKRSILSLFLAIVAFIQVDAQKVYSTNTATVRFIAVDDNDIDATNTKTVSRLESNGKLSFIMLMKDFNFEIIDMDGQRIDKILVKISNELKETLSEN